MKKNKTENKEKSPKPKKRLRKQIWIIIIVICLIALAIYGLKILLWNEDNHNINKQIEEIKEITEVEEVKDTKETKTVNPPKKNTESDYWKYIKLPLISVDFTELLKKNSDTVGFIKVNGTNINYPIVQAKDNDYYLNHSFDKKKNAGGWVYLDYRNDINDLQDNTIIYAHGRTNNTMFGTLRNVIKNSWYKDTNNYVVNLSTPEENTLWQVFSVYKIKTELYYLTSSFGTEESHQKFIDTLLKRSKYDFKAEVTTKDKILTLSTCYDDNYKVVLHAKLIKQAAR